VDRQYTNLIEYLLACTPDRAVDDAQFPLMSLSFFGPSLGEKPMAVMDRLPLQPARQSHAFLKDAKGARQRAPQVLVARGPSTRPIGVSAMTAIGRHAVFTDPPR
jgi:hypothetical protein